MSSKAKPVTTKDGADPMLQETYLQDDAKDFEPSTDEIAAFEERLQLGSAGQPTHAGAHNARRSSGAAAANGPARPSNTVAAAPSSASHPTQPAGSGTSSPSAAQRHAAHRRLSEEEQAEAQQRKEDVDDVRHLDARFGGADDDSD